MDMLKNAAATATSLALATQQQWPNVVIPHYAERTSGLRELADTPLIVFSPVVKFDREEWEQFSVTNQGWTLEGHKFQGSTTPITSIPPQIHEDLVSATPLSAFAAGPFAPVWQMSPVPDDLTAVNFNLEGNEVYVKLEEYVDSHRIPAISSIFDMSELFGRSFSATDKVPRSIALEPIYETFDGDSEAVGHYLSVIEWSTFFSDVLHQGVNGIIVVLKNSCGQAYSFVINGSEATFIGEGDLHDPEFNDHRRSAQLFDPSDEIRDQEDSHCFYSVDIYPSETFKDDYTTADPIIYTAVVFAVMVGTGLAFYLYELFIQRQQKKVLAKVAKTNAIVSSLFPENVRDRLMNGEDKDSNGKGKDKNLYGKQGLKSFLDESKAKDLEAIGESKPIADLFPHTVSIASASFASVSWCSSNHEYVAILVVYRPSCSLISPVSPLGALSENPRKCLFSSRPSTRPLTRSPSNAVYSRLKRLGIVTSPSAVFLSLARTMLL